MSVQHPHVYYPVNLVLPHKYAPLVIPYEKILGIFFGGFAVVFGTAWLLSAKFKLSNTDRALACWFLCTGFIHLVIEGNVVLNSKFYMDTSGNILNEIWKEYAKADSRYASRDPFTIQMEAVTAFVEGPACFLIVYALLTRKAFRWTTMLMVSLGQLYGDVLYYLTCFHVGVDMHSRPEPLYFYGYFLVVNFIWIVVPLAVIVHCVRNLNAAAAKSAKKKSK